MCRGPTAFSQVLKSAPFFVPSLSPMAGLEAGPGGGGKWPWLSAAEIAAMSPSLRDNIDATREARYRKDGASFLRTLCTTLSAYVPSTGRHTTHSHTHDNYTAA